MPLIATRHTIALGAMATLATLAGCGGSSDNDAPPAPKEVAITTKVIDGYLRNVLVCLDTNTNGSCDSNEPQGTSGAGGAVSFNAPEADANNYPLVAMVTPDAVDEDGHTVTTSYMLSTPAGATEAITPLTTLVHAQMAATGEDTATAAQSIQAMLGLSNTPLQDFIATGDSQAGNIARVMAVVTQKVLIQTEGAKDSAGTAVPPSVANRTIQRALLAQLSNMSLALHDAPPANEDAMQAAAAQVAAATLLTPGNLAQAAAEMSNPQPVPVGEAYNNLTWFVYSDKQNYTLQTLNATAAQNTPDSEGKRYFTESRTVMLEGVAQPWETGIVAWTGNGWYQCPNDHLHVVTSVPSANTNESLYCGAVRTQGRPLTESIANHNMRETIVRIRQAGGLFTNWGPAPSQVDANATWPEGSQLLLNTAHGQAGGDLLVSRAMLPPASGDPATTPWRTASLADFLAWYRGDYDSANVTTQNINALNSYNVLSQRWYAKSDGTYGFKRYFMGFDSATQGARFYECEGDMSKLPLEVRHVVGSCKVLMSTTYTIEPLGNNAQVLRFAQAPAQLDLRTHPTFIERKIGEEKITFNGRQGKSYTEQQAHLNHTAMQALLQQLGIAAP